MKEHIYIVMNRMTNGLWTIADFWELPFAHSRFSTAQKMRRAIEERQAENHWRYRKSKLVKVVVQP